MIGVAYVSDSEMTNKFCTGVRGMLPYQRTSTGRTALKNLRVEIGTPSNLSGDLPDGHEWGESSSFDRGLPNYFVTLGDISKALGADTTRFGGDE